MDVNNGMRLGERRQVADYLQGIIANLYVLSIKTHTYHWNATGLHFRTFHLMFGEQYLQLQDQADILAERIRQLGFPVVLTIQELDRAYIKPTTDITTAMTSVARLTKDYEELMGQCREAMKSAEQCQDPVSVGIIVSVLTMLEKTAWVLRATKHDTEL